MNPIDIRQIIQSHGQKFYDELGTVSKYLQYLAGELMSGNEEYIKRLLLENQPLTIGAENILKTGFTVNQKEFLKELMKERQFYKQEISKLNDAIDRQSMDLDSS